MPNRISPTLLAQKKALTHEETLEVCALLGQFRTTKQVLQEAKTRFGKELSTRQVNSYLRDPHWKKFIFQYRDEFVTELSHIPIYHKRVRLERLEELYQKAETRPVKSQYEDVRKTRELLEILSRAREEADRVGAETTNILSIQFRGMSDEQLLEEKQRVMGRLQTLELKKEGTINGEAVATQQGT